MGGNWGLAASDSARQLLLGCSLPPLGCSVLLAHCWLLLTWLVRLLLPNSGPHPDAFESHQSVSTPKSNVVRIMYFKHQAISIKRGVIKTRWVITPYLNVFSPPWCDFTQSYVLNSQCYKNAKDLFFTSFHGVTYGIIMYVKCAMYEQNTCLGFTLIWHVLLLS